jgi:uncharacterized protein (DUF1499 family)
MVRRVALEEPPSRLAIWSRRLGLFALVVALLAVIIVRGGFVETIPGFVVLAGALVIAAAAVLLALAAFVVIWNEGNPGLGRALVGALIGIALIAYPAFIVARGYALPALADITTDPGDPPRFEAIARVRPREANPIAYPGPQAAQTQRAAYADIAPLQLASTPDEAYRAALEVIKKRKWAVIDERSPQGGRRDGRIEAVARTTIMGFRDDIVIRIRRSSAGAVVDFRSASRYGQRDFGSNARRIRSLSEDIEEEAANQPAAAR